MLGKVIPRPTFGGLSLAFRLPTIHRNASRRMFEEFRGSKGSYFDAAHGESLIVEEFSGPKGSHFDTAHEQELDY